jgi:hypothetical protein
MPNFSTEQERKKWASLQQSAGASMQAIVQGRGTTQDFQKVGNILNQQGGLAAQVFAQAVSAAEVQAKKFQAAYELVLKAREGETLTAYELALNDQLSKLAPDLINSIREIVELAVVSSNEDLSRTMGGRFSDLQELLPPKDLPTVDDVLAAQELLAEKLVATDEENWKVREPALLEKIAQLFESTLRNLAERINRERASRGGAPQPGAQVPMLAGPEPQNVLQKAMPLLAAPATSNAMVPVSGDDAAQSTAVVGVSQKTQQNLTTAATQQESLYEKLNRLIPTLPAFNRGPKKQADSEDEEKKADTWWRSFKDWFGDRKDQFDKFRKDNGGWLSALGTTLALMLTDPQLFTMLGNALKKYLTWDNIVSVVEKSWNWLNDKAKDVLDWVMDTLGLRKALDAGKKGIEQNSPATPIINAVDAWKSGKESKGKIITDALLGKGTVDQVKDLIYGTPDASGHLSSMGTLKDLAFGPAGKDNMLRNWIFNDGNKTSSSSTSATGGATNLNQSTINSMASSVGMGSGLSSTATVDAANVSMKPGVATLPAGAAPDASGGAGFDMPQKGAMQMGISSFNYTTGITDALPLMNTYHFTGG